MAHVRTETQNLTFNAAGDAQTVQFDLTGITYIAIFAWWHDGNGHTDLASAPTIGGVSSVSKGAVFEQGNVRVRGYELVDPPTGASVNVVVDPGAGVGTATFAGVTILGFNDDTEATPSDALVTNSGTDTSAELTVSSATGDIPIYFVCVRTGFAPSGLAPTNYTPREDHINGVGLVGAGEGVGAASVAFSAAISAGAVNEWATMGWNINVAVPLIGVRGRILPWTEAP